MGRDEDLYRVMDLKALRCFWAMAKEGSLTRAGIELGISEPAVSQRIRSIERYLGTKLYEASGGRVALTDSGRRLFQMAIDLFDRLEDFETGLGELETTGSITLAAEDSVHLYLLPPVVERFIRDFPRVRLRLPSRTVGQTVAMVQQDKADLGIVAQCSLPAGLTFIPWRAFPAYLLLPLGHPLARRDARRVWDLLDYATAMRYPLILAESEGYRHRIREALRRRGLPFNVAFEAGTFEILKRYVAAGVGIGVISGISLPEDDGSKLIALEIPREFEGDTTYGVVMREGKHVSRALAGLLTLLDILLP
jgi:DNA-binding transcriptional LysR family regulator